MRNMISRVITLILIVINFTAIAQNASRYSASYISDYVVDIYDELEGRSYHLVIKSDYLPVLSDYTIIYNDSSFYLISNTSSEIFRSANNELSHFGSDIQHYALQHSPYIFVDTTLFSFGGYGFWTTKNILRTWDNDEGWLPIIFPESSKVLKRSHGAVLYYSDSILYIAGGIVKSDKNALKDVTVPFLQKVNLLKRDVEIERLPIDINLDKLIYRTGDSLIVRSDNKTFLYRISINTAINLEPTEEYYKTLKQDALFLEGTSFYSPSRAVRYSFDDFFLISGIEDPVSLTLEIIVGFVILLFIVLIIIVIERRNKTEKVFFKDDTIRCGKNTVLLQTNEAEVMRLFAYNRTLPSEAVARALPEHISYSHRNRMKLELINSLNQKIADISGQTKLDAITKRKDIRDSRMSVYSLREDITIEGK